MQKSITKDFQVQEEKTLESFDGTLKNKPVLGIVIIGADSDATTVGGNTNAAASAYKSTFVTLYDINGSKIVTDLPFRNIINASQNNALGYYPFSTPVLINYYDSRINCKNTSGQTANYMEIELIYVED